MTDRRRDALLVVLGAALAALTIRRGIGPHDEGLMLQAGERIADGQWPYRDFWTNYLPGQALVLGALTKVLGPSLLVWRIVRVVVAAVTALLVHRLVRRGGGGEAWALAAWAAAAGAMAFAQGPGPTAPALALALAALLARGPARGGALAGVAFFFRPEIGLAAALGVALGAGRGAGPGVQEAEAADAPDAAPRGRRPAARALGAAAVVGAVLLAPFALVAPGDLLDQVPGFLAIQDLQRLPFPLSVASADPNKVLEALFPAVLVAACAVAVATAIGVRGSGRAGAVAPLAPLTLAGLAYLIGRTDEFHQLALAVPLAAVLAILGARGPRLPAAACAAALGLIVLHGLERRAGEVLNPPALGAIESPVADGVRAPAATAESLNPVLAEIARRTGPREAIYVAPPRHDRVRVGNPLLYVLARRRNATRYDVMQPGVVTTAAVQREIVADLERRRVRVVVRWVAPEAARREDNGAGRERGSTLLDEHIAATFRPVLRTPELVVSIRRASTRPVAASLPLLPAQGR